MLEVWIFVPTGLERIVPLFFVQVEVDALGHQYRPVVDGPRHLYLRALGRELPGLCGVVWGCVQVGDIQMSWFATAPACYRAKQLHPQTRTPLALSCTYLARAHVRVGPASGRLYRPSERSKSSSLTTALAVQAGGRTFSISHQRIHCDTSP